MLRQDEVVSRRQKYTEALRQLEHLHDAGKVDRATYEMQKRALLKESDGPPLLLKVIGVVMILFVLWVIVMAVGSAMQPG